MVLDFQRKTFIARSWRIFASSLTLVLANLLTGQIEVMTPLTVGDLILKMTAYVLHERVWSLTN